MNTEKAKQLHYEIGRALANYVDDESIPGQEVVAMTLDSLAMGAAAVIAGTTSRERTREFFNERLDFWLSRGRRFKSNLDTTSQ